MLIVNETEAQNIFAEAATSSDLKVWKGKIHARGLQHVIITRGAQPTRVISESSLLEVPAHPVTPVDTVGAGDTFAGAFAAHFAEGTAIKEAVRWANAAAALSTLKSGAQEGVPYRGDVQSALTQAGGK